MPSQDAISQSVNRYLEVVAPRSPDPAGLLQVRGSLAPQAIQHHTQHDPALPLIACYLELGMTTHRATDRFKRRAPSAAGRSQTALAPSLGPALLDQHPVVVALRVRLAQIELDVAEKDRTIASLQDDVEVLQETNRSLVRDYGLTRG